METNKLSTSFLKSSNTIVRDEFCILPSTDMPKRETIGSKLYRTRLEQGLSLAQLRDRINQEFRFEMGETTIRVQEQDKVPNPGIKTLEFLALGLGLDPLELISLGLDDPPELDPGFKETQFAQMWRGYRKLSKEQKLFVDQLIKIVIEKIG